MEFLHGNQKDYLVKILVLLAHGRVSKLVYDNARIKVKFNRDLLKLNKVTYNHGPIVNIYIVYRLIPTTKDSSVTLQNRLFDAVKLTKNTDIDKYKYSGYGIGFDSRGSFAHPSGGYGRNVIIFGADLNSFTHANNKTRRILVLGKDVIQGIDCKKCYVEKMYSTNFTVDNKKFCLSLNYNGDSSYVFVNGKEIINFKAKDSETLPYPLCLGNISRGFNLGYMEKTGLTGYIYDFSVDYWTIANDKIPVIHKYLIFFTAMTFFGCSVLNLNSLECVSMNNQECKIRSEIVIVITNEHMFYPIALQ